MVKRIISVVLAAAVIAGFAAVSSAAAYTTDKITGSYSNWTETCYYDSDYSATYVTLAAEGIKNSKSLGAKRSTWEKDAAALDHNVWYFNLLSNRGYFTGYYKIGNKMYYNRGYNSKK